MTNKSFSYLKNTRRKIAIIISLLCGVLLIFQNCGQKNMSFQNPPPIEVNPIIPDPDVEKKDDPIMRKVQVNQVVANRILTANYFISVFGPKITNFVTSTVAEQSNDFGSGSTIYDRVITANCNTTKNIYSPCATNIPLSLSAPDSIGVGIRREAFRIRTCHTAVNNYTLDALRKIDSKATTANPPTLTNSNISKAFNLFYKGRRPASTEVLESLLIVAHQEEKPFDSWKKVILTVCLSPHWQVL